MLKRLFDIMFSAGVLTVSLPVLAILALLIAIRRDGTVLFWQDRLGRHKHPFSICKYRSMTAGEVHSLGRIARPLGLDELPQFWNILIGDMSIVGPRPLTVADTQRLGWDGSEHHQRWQVKPGLVGLAQFSPVCDRDVSWALDVYYLQHAGLWLDCKIIGWSVAVPILGKQRIARWLNLPQRLALIQSVEQITAEPITAEQVTKD